MKNNLNKISQDKILITGGGGLVGYSLILRLQDKYKIISLDKGASAGLNKLFNQNVKFVKGDITDEKLLDKLVKQSGIIIHLAGGGGNPACVNNPVWAVRTHILGTGLLIKKALKYKINKFVFASSQAVYTTFHKRSLPFKENFNLEPDDLYGMLKKSAEDLIIKSGLNYVILRFANIYGHSSFRPFQVGGAINNFIGSAVGDKQIQIYGTGEQGIDYVNISDAVSALDLVLGQSKKEIYNAGSGRLVKIKEIAATVREIFKNELCQAVKIKKLPAPADKIWPDRLMSISKIKKDLGWKPIISLEEGLKEMIINYCNKI